MSRCPATFCATAFDASFASRSAPAASRSGHGRRAARLSRRARRRSRSARPVLRRCAPRGTPPPRRVDDDAAAALHNSAMARERRMRIRGMIGDLRQDLQLRVPHAAPRRRVHRVRRRDHRARHRRERDGVQRRERTAPSSAAVHRSRAPGLDSERTPIRACRPRQRRSIRISRSSARIDRSPRSPAYFAFYGVGDMKLSVGNDAVRLSAVPVTQNFFPLLGVKPVIGARFTAEESRVERTEGGADQPRAVAAALLIRPGIVGRTVMLNGAVDDGRRRVAGVVRFRLRVRAGYAHRHLHAVSVTPETNRWGNTLSIIGRLKPGVTMRPPPRSSRCSCRESRARIRTRTSFRRPCSSSARSRERSDAVGAHRARVRPSASSCSSSARTCRTCCSRAPRLDRRRWPFARRSARAAAASFGRC